MLAERIVETAVLVALAVPALRAMGSAAYRRVFPFDTMRIAAGTAVYLALVAAVAMLAPVLLRPAAVLALGIGGYVLWRARPGHGASSGLPPGSLSPLPVRPWSDPGFYARQAARYGDTFKLSQFGRPMVCIVGLERANRFLREHDDELVVPPLPFSRFIEGGYLRYLPEESHARYRRLFRSIFHSEAVANAEPRLAAVFHRSLARMAERSGGDGSVVVKAPFMRMMFVAWTELFYGIGEEHPDFARLEELHRVIDIRRARWARRRRVEPALGEIEAILARRAAAFAPDEADDPSCFLAALVAGDPEALADRTVVGNLIYILQVTWGDVTGLLLWTFKMLGDHPVWRERLERTAADSDESGRDLATRIVQETLRLEQSESRYRRAAADLAIDGFRIPRGWLVRMCVRESHQDAAAFPDPGAFDPDRFGDEPLPRDRYSPFGIYRLACIGEELTKVVGATFALGLVSGFEWRVVEDGPAEINSWAHNAPSPRLRVRMAPRVPTP